MKQIPLKCGKRVTDSSQAVRGDWHFVAMSDRQKAYEMYLFSRLRCNDHIPCVHCERETAYFESMSSAYAQTFLSLPVISYYSLSFSLFLTKFASKARIVSHLLMFVVNFGYQYFLFDIFFSKHFFSKAFFFNFQPNFGCSQILIKIIISFGNKLPKSYFLYVKITREI